MGFKYQITLFLLSLLVVANVSALGQRLTGIVVIGNDIGSKSLSEQQVIEAFKAKNNFWSNGKTLSVCLPETQSKDAATVCKGVYGKSVSEVQKFWLSQVFQGRSRAPHFFDSDADMIDYVSKTPGAIGAFVNERNISIPAELLIQINP
jgi:hypothetical protein